MDRGSANIHYLMIVVRGTLTRKQINYCDDLGTSQNINSSTSNKEILVHRTFYFVFFPVPIKMLLSLHIDC